MMSFKILLFFSLVCVATLTLAETEDEPKNFEELNRVIGGYPASKDYSKFTVLFKRASDNSNLCAGTLIKSNKVLTNAFCAKKMSMNDVKAVLNTLSSATPDRDAVIKRVIRIASHPHYDPKYRMYDIAVITLDSPVILPTLAIDSSANNVNGRTGTAFGWGYNRVPGAQNLQYATYTIFQKNDQCVKHYNNNYLSNENYFICLQADRVTSCSVDAGGPIMSNSGYLIGINSGEDCNAGRPSVALRLNDFWMEWINQQ